jgi:hypothetical protein
MDASLCVPRLPPDTEDSVESGTVCPIPTAQALHLMADLVAEGIRPPVLVLRWGPEGNHFQAVTYEDTEHTFYSTNLVQLAERRNAVLVQHGWKAIDVIEYDMDKTTRAAAAALMAVPRAALAPRMAQAGTIGEAAARSRTESREGSELQMNNEGRTGGAETLALRSVHRNIPEAANVNNSDTEQSGPATEPARTN